MNVTLEPKKTAIQESAMGGLKTTSRSGRKESGFALVLAILSLMLLTFLGLTLATTTSTELQIATNYRWSQQALYNAEAGVEYGKALLTNMNWQNILPAARPSTALWDGVNPPLGTPTAPLSRTDQWGQPTRNFENTACDRRGYGMGYGVVLDDGSTAGAPFQNVTNILGQSLNGSVTIWVRRPVEVQPNGDLRDYGLDDDNLILVAEGIAPQRTILGINRAVRVIEVTLSRVSEVSEDCSMRDQAQSGGGKGGGGFAKCVPVTASGLNGALGATVTEISTTAN